MYVIMGVGTMGAPGAESYIMLNYIIGVGSGGLGGL